MAEHTAPTPADEERYVWVRHSTDMNATALHVDEWQGTNRFQAAVRDIARDGVSLVTNGPLTPGMQLLIEMPDAATGLPTSLLMARLDDATAQADGQWILRCTFVSHLTDDDLRPFGAHLVRPEGADQRRWVRFPCRAPAFFQLLRSFDAHSWPAMVVNISASGLGIVVGQPIEVGTLLRIDVAAPEAKTPLRVVGCVVRYNYLSGKEWLLGCNFLRQLSDKELEAYKKPA